MNRLKVPSFTFQGGREQRQWDVLFFAHFWAFDKKWSTPENQILIFPALVKPLKLDSLESGVRADKK